MFSNNNKISIRQLKVLLILDIFSTTSLILPKVATDAAGRDGWLSIVIGTGLSGIYAYIILRLAKKIKGNFVEYCKSVVGKMLSYVIGAIYIIKIILSASFGVRLFGELIKDILLPNTSVKIIIITMLLLAAYGASKGFEGRGRMGEILLFIVFVPIVIVLAFAVPHVDIKKLTPLLTGSTIGIVKGSYSVLLTYSALELLLFATPFLLKPERTGRAATTSLVLVGLFNVIMYVVTVGTLGVIGTKKQLWSAITIMQVTKLPGAFMERQDALMISFWILSLFAVINAYIFYLSVITRQMFEIKEHRYLVWIFTPVIYFVSLYPSNVIEAYNKFSWFMAFIGMPISVILPVIILFIAKIRGRKQYA